MNWRFLASWVLICTGVMVGARCQELNNYHSPYSIDFSFPLAELLAPDSKSPRDNWHDESAIPYHLWYTHRTLRKWGAWGPGPRHYPPIDEWYSASVAWKRQRVLAVAQELIGLPYQHHHIPDWDPPPGWPWKAVAYGRNSKGMDCSDFTSWVYNYGLGIKLKTGIRQQAETVDITGPGGQGYIRAKTIYNDNGYDGLVKKLMTGDLLYIRNKEGRIAHVIMWVGRHGQSPDGAPLVIDCTGPEHRDCNGKQIPIGVQLRPFLPDEWYYKSFDHAHRLLYK